MKKSTKNWLIAVLAFVVLAAGIALAFICQPVNANKYINADYEDVLTNRDSSAIFYETEFVLDGFLDERGSKAEAVSCQSVFQIPDTVLYYNRDFVEDTLGVAFDAGHWGGSFACDPREVKVTLNQAIQILDKTNIVKPHSDKVTLRWPLGARYDNALYIFGSTTTEYYIYVDAMTGEVNELDVVNRDEENDTTAIVAAPVNTVAVER